MINIDVSATAFYESGPLPEVVAKILGRRSLDELRRGIPDRELTKLEKILKSLRIQVTHRGESKKKYKITGLTRSTADHTNFKDESVLNCLLQNILPSNTTSVLTTPSCLVLPSERIFSCLWKFVKFSLVSVT